MQSPEGNGRQLAVVPRSLALVPVEPEAAPNWTGPPRLSISQAISRYWYLLVVIPAVLIGGAAYYGLHRTPTFTAQSRLNVGRVDVVAQSSPGYVQATQSLAAAYGQAATAEPVVNPAARRLHMDPTVLVNRIGATPVPSSSVVAVQGKAPDAATAIREANVTSAVLIDYVARLNAASADTSRLLRQYRHAALIASRADANQQHAERAYGLSPTAANKQRDIDAQAAASAADLRRDTLSTIYANIAQNGGASVSLSPLTHATTASSDRSSTLQRMIFIAAIIGLALGAGIAVLRANQLTRRARPL